MKNKLVNQELYTARELREAMEDILYTARELCEAMEDIRQYSFGTRLKSIVLRDRANQTRQQARTLRQKAREARQSLKEQVQNVEKSLETFEGLNGLLQPESFFKDETDRQTDRQTDKPNLQDLFLKELSRAYGIPPLMKMFNIQTLFSKESSQA